MGTEVLRPQDCLIHHTIRVAPVRRKSNNHGNGNGPTRPIVNGNRKVQVRPEQQRRRSPEPAAAWPKRSASVGDLKAKRPNQVGIGQVTILRRGESIDWKERNGDVFSGTTERIGPCPEMVPKQIRMPRPSSFDVYAGSATSLSPSPRAVPLPSFFNRKSNPNTAAVADSATKDLRRLLRLE